MKKILVFIMLISLFACENWLDVNPKSRVKEDDLFANESGFQTALFGIYTSMAASSLYGEELTMSFMDVLAQYYNMPSSVHVYFTASSYDYTSAAMESKVNTIWLRMYRIIMNCNNLLENLEGKEGLFAEGHYALIKGEVLGVRAYLHFDLLRLFAPSFTAGKDQPAIPYVDKVVRTPFPQLTSQQVVGRILQDCKEAMDCLRAYDPMGPRNISDENDRFLQYRPERMNYYAVQALTARVNLWAGNSGEAETISGDLIKARTAVNEVLFQLYSDKVMKYSDDFFNTNLENSRKLAVTQKVREQIYEVSRYKSFDRRITSWMELEPGSIEGEEGQEMTGSYLVTKYTKGSAYQNNLPLIRMTEVYYISAECKADEQEGLNLLNKVRQSYGILETTDLKAETSVFEDELFKEYRKSFLAEGQVFYYMKRRDFKEIPNVILVESARRIYTLPMPQSELEFGKLIK